MSTVKKKDVFQMMGAIQRLTFDRADPKFTYSLVKNKSKLQSVLKKIDEERKQPVPIPEFEKERIALCEEFSKKDKDGNAIINEKGYDIANPKAFGDSIEVLKTKYSKEFEENEKITEENNKLMEEEIEIELHTISISMFPDTINVSQMEALLPMIKEDDKESVQNKVKRIQ